MLEPISSQLIASTEPARTTLVLSNLDDVYVHHEAQVDVCREKPCYQPGGWGVVVAHAIDAETRARVGILKFVLTTPVDPRFDPFACTLDGDPGQTGCLNYIYTASYSPLAPEDGGQGTQQSVSGFLYWFVTE